MKYLGMDVGSLYVGLVLVDEKGRVLAREYLRHQGDPGAVARSLLQDLPLDEIAAVVRTGSGCAAIPIGGIVIDAVVAGVGGMRHLHPDVRNIVAIGGGSFSLTCLDAAGAYRRSTVNSACASGTGAFLEGQAARLQVPPTELAARAMAYPDVPPPVATRCAVFAKSDMIHLQQEGHSIEAIAAGLCVGLGHSIVDGLLNGHVVEGLTAIVGGVARNAVVVRSVSEKLGVETVVPERPELVGALGAALEALRKPQEARPDFTWVREAPPGETERGSETFLRPPLELTSTTYPDFAVHDRWVDEDESEVAIMRPVRGSVRVALGVDIGSTSTKATVVDGAGQVVGWVYRKTAGDPIRAMQHVLSAFRRMERRGGFTLDVRGVGTTGSGRRLIGALIGADLVVNEITAHARAAIFLDPKVDTIIELGGQDAKFTQLQNGMVYNSVMNHVCAAGTGSFIEEQALKLGIPLAAYSDSCMGCACPKTSDRCTVYMERDLELLLAQGWSRESLAAAVLHSVRDNYLNKVVNGLHIGDHICFQGATARNRALVAAFEQELGRPIRVSPFCHVTGALGMSLLVQERIPEADRSARFRGFGFADEAVAVRSETCELCHNRCHLSLIAAGGDDLAWGLKCGREYDQEAVRIQHLPGYDLWRRRDKAWLSPPPVPGPGEQGGSAARRRPWRVGVLRSLGTYGTWPYWRAFLLALGCQPVLSPPSTSDTFRLGREVAAAEYCAPVVASHGHARRMVEQAQADWVLVPHLIREPLVKGFRDSHYCAYVQSHPSVLRSLAELDLEKRILTPVVQMNLPDDHQVERLGQVLCDPLDVTKADIRRALPLARSAAQGVEEEARRLGAEGLEGLEARGELGIVCIGRPYNTTDGALTLDMPRKIAALGYTVLFQDMLTFDVERILPEFEGMYWHQGQKILAAADYVARHPRLFAVYFTHFMCGPDSYIMTYFKDIMGRAGKPYLCLQFDGHGADAGYLTRVEAALESFHACSGIPRPVVDGPEGGVSRRRPQVAAGTAPAGVRRT